MLFTLALALSIPYFWMGKLTQKRPMPDVQSKSVFERHFRGFHKEGGPPLLAHLKQLIDPNEMWCGGFAWIKAARSGHTD